MKWFTGGIGEAIQQAKDKTFVVFVEGTSALIVCVNILMI